MVFGNMQDKNYKIFGKIKYLGSNEILSLNSIPE